MDYQGIVAEIQAWCVRHLGEDLGARLAALAKPGFALERAYGDAPRIGRHRVGGPALLNPGTPWPETVGGFPLTLVAVLDTDELAPWLGAHLPTRLGLVNVFWLQPDFQYEEDDRFVELMKPYEHWWGRRDRPDECQIVLADPSRAIEIVAPLPGRTLSQQSLNAAPIVTLPSFVEEAQDPSLRAFEFHALPDFDGNGGALPSDMRLGKAWVDFCRTRLGYRPGDTQAFGWPFIDQWVGKREEDYVHLLTLPGHLWGGDHDGGFERIMVSPDDLRIGGFTSATYEQDGLH